MSVLSELLKNVKMDDLADELCDEILEKIFLNIKKEYILNIGILKIKLEIGVVKREKREDLPSCKELFYIATEKGVFIGYLKFSL